jgi:hypothetical protein
MFHLPPASHPARELFDMRDLVAKLDPRDAALLPSIASARRWALNLFEADTTGAMRRVAIVIIRANDERWLVTFGRRGGWRKEWNFGTGRA